MYSPHLLRKCGLYYLYMNGIERHLGVFNRHLKNIKLTFTTISVGILLAISSVAMVANAQEETLESNNAEPMHFAEEVKEMNEERKTETQTSQPDHIEKVEEREELMGERNEVRQSALTERTQERIINLAANVSNKTEGAIERIDNIANRFESRIEKLEATGTDTTEARTHLNDAYFSIHKAIDTLSNIDVIVDNVVYSENPRATWITAKSTYQTTKAHLTVAHESLRLTLEALRSAMEVTPEIETNEQEI